MKILNYIFIYTFSLCIAAHAITLTQICMGPDHCDPGIDWVISCHTQPPVHHNSHDCSFDHSNNECIDILITSIAISSNNIHLNNQPTESKPLILTQVRQLFFKYIVISKSYIILTLFFLTTFFVFYQGHPDFYFF